VYQCFDNQSEHHPVWNASTVAAQRMRGVELGSLGQESRELFPERLKER